MAGKIGGDDDDVIGDINVTPFVDIVLVLLIIFMVTSTYIVRASIEVDLPKAASGGESVKSTLNVVLTKEGQVLLNGEASTPEKLADFVKAEKVKDKDLQAVIAADKGVEYGEVMKIIDIVKINGVKSFALNIEREVKAGGK